MTEAERPAQEETRFRRGVRHGHRWGMYIAVGIIVATVVYLILLIAQNSRHVEVDYIFGQAHARLIWLIVVSALIGWLGGLATSYLVRRRTRRPR